jgi:hypothetical protein
VGGGGSNTIRGLESGGLVKDIVGVTGAENRGKIGNLERNRSLPAVVKREGVLRGRAKEEGIVNRGVSVVNVVDANGRDVPGVLGGVTLYILAEGEARVGVEPGLDLVTDKKGEDDGLGLVLVGVNNVKLEDVLATLLGDSLGDGLGKRTSVGPLGTTRPLEGRVLAGGANNVLGDLGCDAGGDVLIDVVVGGDGGQLAG